MSDVWELKRIFLFNTWYTEAHFFVPYDSTFVAKVLIQELRTFDYFIILGWQLSLKNICTNKTFIIYVDEGSFLSCTTWHYSTPPAKIVRFKFVKSMMSRTWANIQ